MTPTFESKMHFRGFAFLPEFSGLRIMMMPVILGDLKSIPDSMEQWRPAIERLFQFGGHEGSVGYLTIDEKSVGVGKTHRRAGLHVDGICSQGKGIWAGGWGGVGTGMISVSSVPGCAAWSQKFVGWPGKEGDCEHLADQRQKDAQIVLGEFEAYWMDGLCVHESLPMKIDTKRQFVRLSLPSTAPWFEGYTENPLGVKPSGEILSRRQFMNSTKVAIPS